MTKEQVKILSEFIKLTVHDTINKNVKPTEDYIFEHLLKAERDLEKL